MRFEFEPTGKLDLANGKGAPGRAQLYVDNQLVGQTEIPVTVPILFDLGGLVRSEIGSPVVNDYQTPFRFTGELIIDSEAEMRMAMARQ